MDVCNFSASKFEGQMAHSTVSGAGEIGTYQRLMKFEDAQRAMPVMSTFSNSIRRLDRNAE